MTEDLFKLCSKTKNKSHKYKLSVGGKIAHDIKCKCSMHIEKYIELYATTKEIERGVKTDKVIKITCLRKCGYVNKITQRNTDDKNVWSQSDGSIIVRY